MRKRENRRHQRIAAISITRHKYLTEGLHSLRAVSDIYIEPSQRLHLYLMLSLPLLLCTVHARL